MGAIIVFVIGGLISVVVAIYQFINAVYAGLGYFMGIQLASFSGELLKNSAILSPKYEIYALPALGAFFCIAALILLGGLEKWVLIALTVFTVFFVINWPCFWTRACRVFYRAGFFCNHAICVKKTDFFYSLMAG